MLGTIDFVSCIRANLKGRHYGKQRGDAIVNNFEQKQKAYVSQGLDATTAGARAMKDIWTNMSFETTERAKRLGKTMGIQLDNRMRVSAANEIDVKLFTGADLRGGQIGPRGSRGVALARAATASIEADPRLGNFPNYTSTKASVRGQLFAMFEDVLDHFNKGAFGIQKGKASLPNIVREVFGVNTGDQSAKEFALAWAKVQDTAVDLFNQAGGSLRKLDRYLPNPGQNAAKLMRAGLPRWSQVMKKTLDWGRMRFPDGSIIDPAQYDDVLKNVYDTLTTNGTSKIDPGAFRGQGHAVGNHLNQHRFLILKDADAWLQVQQEFGDGTIFDVFAHHLTAMSHSIAMVDVFGPNPQAGFANLRAEVLKQAASQGGKVRADAEGVLKNVAEPMFDAVSRANPMDPESTLGTMVTSTSNVLMSAQLGSATLIAAPGDFMQSVAVRALHHMGLFDGVGTYLKALVGAPEQKALMLQSGFVSDEAISSVYATTRFSGLATQGPATSRRIADTVMRLNLLQGHTTAARWTMQAELMGLMARSRQTPFQELPFRQFLESSGVTVADWDAFRAIAPHTPRPGVELLQPIDILKSNIPDKQRLYQKLQGMVFDFSRTGVPDATVEAAISLKGTSRADTVPGAILHSFSMYKNFPVSFMMIYGRLAMNTQTAGGRLAFLAGLGAATTLVGALGVQMREITQGRDPMPMNSPAFIGKAMMAGGGLSIWGDFLFGGINQYGGGPKDMIAGPLVQFAGDTTQLALGDVFQWASMAGSLTDKEFKSTTAAKAVEWVKRYGPGTSLWWARLALERAVFDRLSELADPRAYDKQRAKIKRQKTTYGNGYWFAPGERTPSRGPSFTGN